ncbi:acyl n-acyltransferase protein [Apiospora arundinis]|uniref:Acyl n-acyltransferase protein n=1 Tax=Apiospora arundinis TaxID=335852 RepID=A0ABR2J5W7_9PEZI
MAGPPQRHTWVDHWTIHSDGAELHEQANHTERVPYVENSSTPRHRELNSPQGGPGSMNEIALSFAPGEGTAGVSTEQGYHFGMASGGNIARGLEYTETPENTQHVMEAPVTRRAARNQLQESRWAPVAKPKGQEIWREAPKQFVKGNDQSLLKAAPNNKSENSEGNMYVPPHLRQITNRSQQKAPELEPRQQLNAVPLRRNEEYDHGTEFWGRLPARPAPVSASGSTNGDAAQFTAVPKTPVAIKQESEISDLNLKLEASMAIFGVDPPKADSDCDPRGEVPIQTWAEQDWNVTRRPKNKKKSFDSVSIKSTKSITRDSEISGATSAPNWTPASRITEWVGKWAAKVPDFAEASVLQDRPDVYENCDIDCETGLLLPPVEQPIVMRNANDKTTSSKKRMYVTSGSLIARELKKRERMRDHRIEQERAEKARLAPSQINEETEPAMTRVNPFQCRAECHLRPAELGDMTPVAELYNHEVRNGWRALDRDPVYPPSWLQILNGCHEHNLPFVVALSGYRDPSMPITQAGHRVIGFAYLDMACRGIIGSVRTNAKESGRLYVMVDPQYRRARIGTAMVDAVLRAVSPHHTPKEHSYQWENPRENPDYFDYRYDAHSEKRQWCSILMEVYVQNQGTKEDTTKGDEYQTIWNWLEMDLSMNLISHSPRCGCANNLPTSPFLDRLVFEHRCSPAEILP